MCRLKGIVHPNIKIVIYSTSSCSKWMCEFLSSA